MLLESLNSHLGAAPAIMRRWHIRRPQVDVLAIFDGTQRWLGRLDALVVLAILGIEGSLAYRVWVEVSGSAAQHGVRSLAYSLSNTLVSPFRRFETVATVRPGAGLEISSLVAIECYMAAGIGVIVAFWLLQKVIRFGLRRAGFRPAAE